MASPHSRDEQQQHGNSRLVAPSRGPPEQSSSSTSLDVDVDDAGWLMMMMVIASLRPRCHSEKSSDLSPSTRAAELDGVIYGRII